MRASYHMFALLIAAAASVACGDDIGQATVYVMAGDGVSEPARAPGADPCKYSGAPPALNCADGTCAQAVAEGLRHWFAEWDISFVTERPAGRHNTLVLTSAPSDWCRAPGLSGIAALNGDMVETGGVAYVFDAGPASRDVPIAAHELGHLIGLEHVVETADVMSAFSCLDCTAFSGSDLETVGRQFRAVQNERAMLSERLGPRR